jgi:hypothetical protein
MVGGTILEVGKNQSRIVPAFNNPGPSGPGMAATDGNVAVAEAMEKMGKGGWGL